MIRRFARAAARRALRPFRSPAPPGPLHDWNLSPDIHPMEARDGHAGHFIGSDGRDFVDMHSAWGANLLGYGYAPVAEAIAAQAMRFNGLGLPFRAFRRYADRLRGVIPCAEAIRYGKNGSDVTMGAVRIARDFTRRAKVLHRGYHGFHDWWMASVSCPGVPPGLSESIITLASLTPESIRDAFAKHPGEISCLILDPMLPPIASAPQMKEIASITRRAGAILIFDEVVSGMRVAPAGMQAEWGVSPDLACYGKGIANGMPLSVLAGRADLMARGDAVHYGMTFEGEALSLVAGEATLEIVLRENVCGALAVMGMRLKRDFAALAATHGLQAELAGHDARPYLFFQDQGGVSERHLRWLFLQEMLAGGIMTLGTFTPCFTHTEDDLRIVGEGFERSLAAVAEAVRMGTAQPLLNPRVYAGLERARMPLC